MIEQETYDKIVRDYNRDIYDCAKDIVSLRLAGNEDALCRADLRRDSLKDILNDFKDYVEGIVELQYQIKKYELFLIGSGN